MYKRLKRQPGFDLFTFSEDVIYINLSSIFDLSHASLNYFHKYDFDVLQANDKYTADKGFGIPLAIALDTKGPEIRTGKLEGTFSPYFKPF